MNQTSGYDGDGARIQDVSSSVTTYYLRSSVLGGVIIEEMDNSGQKKAGYVCLSGGQLLATQTPGSPDVVTWKHNTPAGTTEYTANSYNTATGRTEFDPLGADLSLSAPPDPPPSEGAGDIGTGHIGGIMDARWSDFFNLSSGCAINGTPAATCSEAITLVNAGAAEQCPNNECARYTVVRGQLTPEVFHIHSDGYSGYELVGSTYRSQGRVVNQEFDRVFDLDADSGTTPQNSGE